MTQAVLLAAGLGTRLGELTKTIPKCLVDVGGKPMLQHWLDKLREVGCTEVFINTHYLAAQVNDFVAGNSDKNMIRLVHEDELLGTAGTLASLRHLLTDDEVFVAHADNFFIDALEGMVAAHRSRSAITVMTMGLFESETPSSCGIVELDSARVVVGFEEKPTHPRSNLANAAVYLLSQTALDEVGEFRDFSTEVVPRLLGRIQGHQFSGPFFDMGTPESLIAARAAANGAS
jgi:mannose-1-phosphate guanylyltransferase